MNEASRRMALGGVLAALGTGIMLLGGVIPAATFCWVFPMSMSSASTVATGC